MLDVPFLLYEISSVIFFLLPLMIMTVLYTKMGLKIHKTSSKTLDTVGLNLKRDDRTQNQY